MYVSVRELKAKLSRYLGMARAGADVVVTSRGRPVARLLPLGAQGRRKPGRRELIQRLKTIPDIHLGAGGRPAGSKTPLRIKPGEKTLAELVIEDRR